MPGKWSAVDGKKMDIGGGKTMYSGGGNGQGGSLAYFAFENTASKTKDQDLKALPAVVAGPIVKKLTAQGGKEERFDFLDLMPENKDQGYFIRVLKAPDGIQITMTGIVLRTKTRIYVIQTVGSLAPNVNLWRAVAESFREL